MGIWSFNWFLGFNIKEVGALASLPQTCTIILIVFGASISDFFHNKGTIS